METMTESGGVIPHHHHPIAGSNFFPQKDASSSSSYFFPSNTGSQSVYRGYGASGVGQDSDNASDINGVMGYGGQHKSHERRDSEERGGRGGDVRRSSGGGGPGIMIPPGVGGGGGDRYYQPSSSSSSMPSSQSSHHLQPHALTPSPTSSSYHHRNQNHHHLHQQQSPHRGMNQFLQHQQQQRLEDEKKMSEGLHSIGETGRSDPSSATELSPEKRPLGKEGAGNMMGGFSPKKGVGMNLPYDGNPMMSPYYHNSSSKLGGPGRHQAGFLNDGRHPMPGFGSSSPMFMSDVRESVKEVYDSFMQTRSGGNNKEEAGSSGKAPEAIPIAYDDSDIQSQQQHQQQQHYREKLERSTSQDAASAMAARNIMSSHEYNHHLYEGGDHQRPRAITMNSMYNRRDNSSSLHQSHPFGTGNKNHDLYTKMREHFNRSEAAMKNHYYFGEKEKDGPAGALPPMSPNSPYLGKHQRRPSGDSRSASHAQQSRQDRMMMMMSPNHQSDHRQSYPTMHQHQYHQHLQSPHHHHHLFQQQQQQQQSDPDGQQLNRSTSVPSSHSNPQRKSLESGGDEDSVHSASVSMRTPTSGEASRRSRSPFGSPTTGSARKSPMRSPLSDPATQKLWPSSGPPGLTPDKAHSLSGESISKTSDKERDEADARISSSASSPKQGDKKYSDNDKEDRNMPKFPTDNSDGTENVTEAGTGSSSPNANNASTTPKLDSSSHSLSPKDEEEDSPNVSFSRKLSRDSSDDTSLPDALPRELMPKKELLSDGEDDSFLSSSANYPPMTPPSPNSSSGMGSFPSSFPQHQQPLPPHPHQQQPFFHSPERLPGHMTHPFGSPRSLQDGPPGMPPAFPFNKDMPGRFPMPGMPRDMPLGPNGSPFMGGPMPPLNMGGDKDVYFCHLCSYSGKSKSDFDNHMGIHFEYNCPHCDYTSRTEGRLKRHIKDFHTDENGRRSMPGRPKVFKCKQCSFSATEKDKFWEHARSHIKEDKLLQCPKCPFVTEYKHHLEYHLRNHFGSKPFKCNKCNYSCVNKSMLNSHMKSHTNVYQYRCSDCTYATKYCHSLKLHLRKYNHKPATVLNQDGSLPQGADAEASGLAVNTKRGPPRGPRGPRKDKNDPYFSQMFGGMPPMPMGMPPAMNPMLKGMMPFWPVMPPSGIPGHPGMMPGLPNMPQHMGMRGSGDRDGMDMRSGGDRAGMDRTSDPEMNGMMSGENSPIKDDDDVMYLPCRLCDFVADGTEALCLHLLQTHKDETGEMASMYGISETALAESLERARKNKMDKADMRMERRMSEMSNESEHDMSEFRRRNTIAGLLSRENRNFGRLNGDKPFWASGYGQRDKSGIEDGRIQDLCYVDDGNEDGDNENESARGMDILQQMTLKFGGGVGSIHAERSKSLDAELIRNAEENRDKEDRNEDGVMTNKPKGHKESPLDLTKPKSASPSIFSNPSSPRRFDDFNSEDDDMRPVWLESGRGSELDKVTETLARKRQFSEADEMNPGSNAAPTSTPNPDVPAIVPRKRARKGKAYKLETLCLKLQERQQSKSPNDSDDLDSENDFNNVEQYQTPLKYSSSSGNEEAEMEREAVDDIKKNDGASDALGENGPREITGKMSGDENLDRKESEKSKIDDSDNIEKELVKDIKTENEDGHGENIIVKEENVESDKDDSQNLDKDKGSDEKEKDNDEEKVDDSLVKTEEPELNEAENSFEKLQEALNDLNKEISEKEENEKDAKLADDDDDEPTSSATSLPDENKTIEKDEEKTEAPKDMPEFDNGNFDEEADNSTVFENGNDNIEDDDDDDDDAKTEILGEDLTTTKDNLFDLSDKENSNDGYGNFDNNSSPSNDKPSEEVQIEDKVDMINTVLENRKKPLPPAVRRGTELAWKLLNDPVNPVTSIPIPVVSPPPPEWKSPSQQQQQQRIPSPMTSPLGSNSAGIGSAIPTPHGHLAGSMTSPMKNGIRLTTNPTPPFNQGGLPPSPSMNLNMKPHLPIPLPPTPMAFIPPTNRMMPEPHNMPRPPHHPPSLPPPIPMSKTVPKDMYECTYCDLSFRDCVMYTVHMGYHSNRNPFKCNSCGIICRDKVEFFLHIARSPHS